MATKHEGLAAGPWPLHRRPVRETLRRGSAPARQGTGPRCEMCGRSVIATHCKRICLRCGFMTGCSEGI